MKKFRFIAIAGLMLIAFSSNIFAVVGVPINSPLDGGLLTILGAAGIAYFIVRKKRK
jgi:hypothetical protein